jgi:hypothetical protein
MPRPLRLALLTALTTAVNVGVAQAASINVAEFRWDLLTDPGIECPAGDASCVPEDPFTQSVFSLTNIWDGPGTVTLFDNALSLPTGTSTLENLEFPFSFTQLAVIGIPDLASASVSFIFDGQTISLGSTLATAGSFAVLRFEPSTTSVPEPGTFGLLATGLCFAARRAWRR